MAKETLRDFQGRIIGYIETYPNGNKRLTDFHNRILGTYEKSLNVTKDFYGRIVAKGDCLTMLLN